MRIIDKNYDEKTVMKYTGGAGAVNRVERVSYSEGKAKGSEAIMITTGSGLQLTILPDRGMDIAHVSFRGVAVSFITKNGVTGPAAVNPHEDEFLRYFNGGLLTTCGLRNVGPSCREENGEFHPLHGRYDTIPAVETGIRRPDSDTVEITGTVNETALFGCHLRLERQITVSNAASMITIEDTLVNSSANDEEFMLLYHFNFGFPFLQNGCFLEFEDSDKVIPRTDEALAGMDRYTIIEEPDDNYSEQVFFHLQDGGEDRFAKVRVVNPELGITATVRYDTSVLPVLAQWKSMKSGDYALGLEPSNNYIKGRIEERKNGTIKTIGAYSKITFRTSVAIGTL
ncbi:MAG: aldose 1-epimerase family protein [Saccharofermentanales bacterium]